MPIGAGIGATQVGCCVMSPNRAAGSPPIIVVMEPMAIIPGPAGIQAANIHGKVISDTLAAGIPPIKTVGAQGETIWRGIGGCGIGVGVGAGGWIGAWQCGAI